MWEWLQKLLGAPPGRVDPAFVDSMSTIAGRPDAIAAEIPPYQRYMPSGPGNRVYGEYMELDPRETFRTQDTIYIHPANGFINSARPNLRSVYSDMDKPIPGHDVPTDYVYGHEIFHKFFAENPDAPIVKDFKAQYNNPSIGANEWFARAAGDATNLLRATANGNFAGYGDALNNAFPGTAKMIDWLLQQPIWHKHPLNHGRSQE
jgi:hypothetical protein